MAPFPRFYLNTIIWVFGLLGLQLVTVSLAGFALARLDFRGKDQIFFLFLTQLIGAGHRTYLAQLSDAGGAGLAGFLSGHDGALYRLGLRHPS